MHGEELGLVLANVLRPQAVGRAVEVLGEALDEANVTLCGSFRDDAGVPPASFCVDGSQGHLLVTHKLSEVEIKDCRHHPRGSVRRASGFVVCWACSVTWR